MKALPWCSLHRPTANVNYILSMLVIILSSASWFFRWCHQRCLPYHLLQETVHGYTDLRPRLAMRAGTPWGPAHLHRQDPNYIGTFPQHPAAPCCTAQAHGGTRHLHIACLCALETPTKTLSLQRTSSPKTFVYITMPPFPEWTRAFGSLMTWKNQWWIGEKKEIGQVAASLWQACACMSTMTYIHLHIVFW